MKRAALLLLPSLLFSACGEEKIQVYRLAKPGAGGAVELPPDHPPMAQGAAMEAPKPGKAAPERMAGSRPAPAPEGSGLLWKAPSNWKEEPASGMRAASFRVPGGGGEAELSVVVLPGEAGGLLANVNRWRGQIGLDPQSEAEFRRSAQRLSSPAGELTLVDFAKQTRVLAAVLPAGGRTWFFKLTGPGPVVSAARGEFIAFLKSLEPAHGKGS